MRMKPWEIKQDMFPRFTWRKESILDCFFVVTCLDNGVSKRVYPRINEDEGYSIDDVTHVEYCGGWPIRTLTLFADEQAVMDYMRRI